MLERSMRKSRHHYFSRLGWLLCVLVQPIVIYGAENDRVECRLGSGVACARPVVKLGEGTGASGRFTRIELERRRATLVETPFDVSRVAVGDAKIADVIVVSPRQVNIVPLRIGETNLLLWDSEGALSAAIEIEVGNKHFRLERELRRILSNQTLRLEG
ncbi:MAG: pilus assembly protein N-terminal domain-containing protein, partial [Myxococcota bacterium]